MGVSNRFDTALPMGLATAFVLTVSSLAAFAMHHYVLVPLDLGYLRIVAFIVAIAGVVQFIETFVRHVSPLLHQLLGVYLPLITSNCAVLGVALIVTDSGVGLAADHRRGARCRARLFHRDALFCGIAGALRNRDDRAGSARGLRSR